jgi:hypothetical protein
VRQREGQTAMMRIFIPQTLADGDKGKDKCCPIKSKSGPGFDSSKESDCRCFVGLGRVGAVAGVMSAIMLTQNE